VASPSQAVPHLDRSCQARDLETSQQARAVADEDDVAPCLAGAAGRDEPHTEPNVASCKVCRSPTSIIRHVTSTREPYRPPPTATGDADADATIPAAR
jgi:hypothetical protein